ncbi:MAG: hypothetical protein AAF492_11025, partial [Verrucomicrobiota bacterium]
LGVGAVTPQAGLIGGLIYKPFYLCGLLLAVIVTWWAPQTWDWTRRLTLPRVAICFSLFIISLILLMTKSYSPFIYFIF